MSSYLQEKLDKERKSESGRLSQASSRSMAHGGSDASVDSHLKSPSKRGNRPRSSGNGADFSKVKHMGLREMEKVSVHYLRAANAPANNPKATETLIKSNFDLKLKIHHYQEKHEEMQRIVESLESEVQDAQNINDQLVAELDKRDKAVGEAVAMIVMLEAKVHELTEANASARLADAAEGQGPSPYEDEDRGRTPVPNAQRPLDKPVHRMPSFLSEQSEQTENLRNAYISIRNSVLTLSPPEEFQGSEIDPKGLASPTLSVLSESSFQSVYGQRAQDKVSAMDLDHDTSVHGGDGVADEAAEHDEIRRVMAAPVPQPGLRLVAEKKGHVGADSPLQRIERLDPVYLSRRDTAHLQKAGADVSKGSDRGRIRDEKRASLSRVRTDAPHGTHAHDPCVPPTPDTISTGTLRRLNTSNDTLSEGEQFLRDNSSTNSTVEGMQIFGNPLQRSRELPARQSTRTAFNNHASPAAGTKAKDFAQTIRRPASAGGNSIFHRKGNDWGSDSDESDAASANSSVDIWLREGTQGDNEGKPSPDLFGFPTNGGSWVPSDMFPNGSRTNGARLDIDDLDTDHMNNLFSIHHAIFSTGGAPTPPPPPHRRSSLHARTGSLTASPRRASGLTKSYVSPERLSAKQRRNSDFVRRESEAAQQAVEQKHGYYPPTSKQPPPRSTLAKIFRRSIGGTSYAIAAPVAATSNASPSTDGAPSNAGMGIPSRVSQVAAEGISTSATPPPILRNPRHGRRDSSGLDIKIAPAPSTETSGPSTPVTVAAPTRHRAGSLTQHLDGNDAVASPAGGRKKWFGKMGSLKNKAS
ncbi:hypothetical protein S40288_00710 [Stachybotrys chartarum IBT 40288]|nr:hypothetical protein S40288_00710 [Stachybotrys chartarum IBT 40288]